MILATCRSDILMQFRSLNQIGAFIRNLALILLLFVSVYDLSGQLYFIRAEFDDDLGEWVIYNETEEEIGELNYRPRGSRDIGDWTIYLNEIHGTIATKWRNDASVWEISYGNVIYTAMPVWRGDITEWKISDGDRTIKIRSVYKTHLEEWEYKGKSGNLFVYTEYEGDLRDWIVENKSADEIPADLSLLISCFALIQAIMSS